MIIISIASQKGGAGKTTLACAIAVAAETAGLSTVLIDLDPQASATVWATLRPAPTPVVTGATPDRLVPVLEASRLAGARLVVIDTAPHSAHAAMEAARLAHLVLVPCRPAAPDLAAIGTTIELARQVARAPVAVVSSAPVRNPLTDQARAAIARYGIDCAPVVIHQRIDHVHAATVGLTAQELAPDGKAAAEVEGLWTWLRSGALNIG